MGLNARTGLAAPGKTRFSAAVADTCGYRLSELVSLWPGFLQGGLRGRRRSRICPTRARVGFLGKLEVLRDRMECI